MKRGYSAPHSHKVQDDEGVWHAREELCPVGTRFVIFSPLPFAPLNLVLIRVQVAAVFRTYPVRTQRLFGNGYPRSVESCNDRKQQSPPAVTAAAALELIFKQWLKSANVVSAVKPALLRAQSRIKPISSTFEIN